MPVTLGAAELLLLEKELLDELLVVALLVELLLEEVEEVVSDDVRDVCELFSELAEETLPLELVSAGSQATAIPTVIATRSNAFAIFFMMMSFLF